MVAVTTGATGPSTGPSTAPFGAQRPRLFGLAYRMLGSAHDAEDVVQDAWLRWVGHGGTVENPRPWLPPVSPRLYLTPPFLLPLAWASYRRRLRRRGHGVVVAPMAPRRARAGWRGEHSPDPRHRDVVRRDRGRPGLGRGAAGRCPGVEHG